MDSAQSLHEDLVRKISDRGSFNPVITVSEFSNTENSDSEMDTGMPSYSSMARRQPRPQFSKQRAPRKEQGEPDPKVKNFQKAIETAERSTLIFNLGMGNVKLLNEKSILSKATLALTEAAAKVEGKASNRPSQDTLDALDDVLSIAKDVKIFGKATKPFRNVRDKNDPRNCTFFTVPIRYKFKDKDSRFEAESVLRD